MGQCRWRCPEFVTLQDQGEWHLIYLPRVTVLLYFSASLNARRHQPRVGFRSSFSHSRLDACGSISNLALGDQGEQLPAILRRRQTSRDPLRPQLQGVFEAQLVRVHTGIAGGLRQEQTDHVVGQQMDLQLFLVILRSGSSARPCPLKSTAAADPFVFPFVPRCHGLWGSSKEYLHARLSRKPDMIG